MEWLQNCGMAPQKRKSSHFLLALAFASFAAIAGILTIDARNDSYKDLSNVRGTKITRPILSSELPACLRSRRSIGC